MTDGKGRTGSSTRSRIHEGLVGARALVGTRYLADPALRSEYVREIAPRTEIALAKVLREIFPDPEARDRPRRVLDLGAGTGAARAAVQAHFGRGVDLQAVDQVPDPVGGVHAVDVTDLGALARATRTKAPFDLVLAAHVLNELAVIAPPTERAGRIASLVTHWCQHLLAEKGTLILLEPALRETSRALLMVRDHLVDSGLRIVAPCFFAGPCPALLRERDWCHDAAEPAVEDQRPDKRKAGPRVDFSYLVVRASGERAHDATLFRIVSDPLPEKGRLRLFACGPSGRHPVVRLNRHASPANADLDRLARGDVARVVGATRAGDGMRISPDTTVTRVGHHQNARTD